MVTACRRCNRTVEITTAEGYCKMCNAKLKYQRIAATMNERLPKINRMLSGV